MRGKKKNSLEEMLNFLDDTTRQKAMIIANQLMLRENISEEQAYRIAVALAKKHCQLNNA